MIPQGESRERDWQAPSTRPAARVAVDGAAVLDSLESAILVTSLDTTIHFANRAVEHVTGLRAAECLGRRAGEVIPGLQSLGNEWLGCALRGAGGPRAIRIDHAGPAGLVQYELIARRHADGACLELRELKEREARTRPSGEGHYEGIVRDFVLRARLFEQVQNGAGARHAFLTTVSHELRTPLTALTGYGELLADQILGPLNDQQQDMVDRMCSVTHHLAVMVEEILTYSSLEAGREVVKAAPSAPGAIVRAALATVAPQAEQKKVAVHLDLAPDLGAMHTDADKVRQILIHLGGNAVKFTDGGQIRFVVRRENGSVRFAVHDTGIGIDSSRFEMLFQPFVQLDGGLTRKHGGTGLGLYIARRFAALLGGRIEVESGVGSGSVFTLVLPERFESPGTDMQEPRNA